MIARLQRMRENEFDDVMVGGATAEVISLNQLSPNCVTSPGRECGFKDWIRVFIVFRKIASLSSKMYVYAGFENWTS